MATGTKRTLAKAATRQKIVEAARLLFEAGGYEAATIRTIAKLAGMSTGGVFSNFDGKEALYREIYDHGPITPEAGRSLVLALGALLAAVKDHPEMQGRQYVDLGIQVNNALAKAA